MTQEIQEKLDVAKAPFQASVEAIDAIPAMVDALEKQKYDLGFEDGLKQAGQAGGSDKVYSDAEMNAEIQPRDAKIAELTGVVAELQAKLDGKDGEMAQALSALKVEVAGKIRAVEIDNLALADELDGGKPEFR